MLRLPSNNARECKMLSIFRRLPFIGITTKETWACTMSSTRNICCSQDMYLGVQCYVSFCNSDQECLTDFMFPSVSLFVLNKDCSGLPWGFSGQPAPVPVRTRTRSHGCGFLRSWVVGFVKPMG